MVGSHNSVGALVVYIRKMFYICSISIKHKYHDTGREKETGQAKKGKAGHLILLFSYQT